MREPSVPMTRPAEERRDFNAEERAMILRGDRAGAKVAWHKRQEKRGG